MKNYKFYHNSNTKLPVIDKNFYKIESQFDLYDILCHLWCAETCAPRLRIAWSKENMTLGQCSITSFLVQDIFGGEVMGILRPGGNYHCYNVVGNVVFDLTSEQFLNEKLDYSKGIKQDRKIHFSKEEKMLRYEKLKLDLINYLKN